MPMRNYIWFVFFFFVFGKEIFFSFFFFFLRFFLGVFFGNLFWEFFERPFLKDLLIKIFFHRKCFLVNHKKYYIFMKKKFEKFEIKIKIFEFSIFSKLDRNNIFGSFIKKNEKAIS